MNKDYKRSNSVTFVNSLNTVRSKRGVNLQEKDATKRVASCLSPEISRSRCGNSSIFVLSYNAVKCTDRSHTSFTNFCRNSKLSDSNRNWKNTRCQPTSIRSIHAQNKEILHRKEFDKEDDKRHGDLRAENGR